MRSGMGPVIARLREGLAQETRTLRYATVLKAFETLIIRAANLVRTPVCTEMRGKTEQIILGVLENRNIALWGKGRKTELRAGLTTARSSVAFLNRMGVLHT